MQAEAEPVSLEWLELVRRKDEDATRRLVERLHPLVLRIVRAHRPRRVAEEDLCQEVLLSVFTDLDQYRGPAPFEHWVSRVAVHSCIDALRRERARPELRWADLSQPEEHALRSALESAEGDSEESRMGARDLVERLLEALPPKDRLLIRWLELEDQSVRDVAAWTGWSVTLVKVRAFRARRRLRRALQHIIDSEKG